MQARNKKWGLTDSSALKSAQKLGASATAGIFETALYLQRFANLLDREG
jgi:hypothetical protein